MNDAKFIKAWRDIIISFFQANISTSQLAKVSKYIEGKKAEYTEEKDEKNKGKILTKIKDKEIELEELKDNPLEIVEWLDKNAIRKISKGSRIVKATHILKFSHGSAPNDGVLVEDECDSSLLTTSSIPAGNKIFDMAHNNGALISVSRFLSLSHNGISIYDLVFMGDFRFLKGFAKNENQYEKWRHGLTGLIEKRGVNSASFAKQIYFPIGNNKYHLLAPLTSSALIEPIFNNVIDARYRKKESCFNKDGFLKSRVNFPSNKVVVVRVGGNNPQNISMLNRGRNWKPDKKAKSSYGIYHVFSCQPPVWQAQLKPPIYIKNLFYELSKNHEVKETIQYLADFLARFESLDLSIKDPKRMRWVEQWLDNLSDEVLVYVKTIQNLPAGWSDNKDIKLKQAHQFLLDCHRQDEEFLNAQESTNWQQIILQDFAIWLNHQLTWANDKLTLQDSHSKLWVKLFEANFREVFESKHDLYQEVEQ